MVGVSLHDLIEFHSGVVDEESNGVPVIVHRAGFMQFGWYRD